MRSLGYNSACGFSLLLLFSQSLGHIKLPAALEISNEIVRGHIFTSVINTAAIAIGDIALGIEKNV